MWAVSCPPTCTLPASQSSYSPAEHRKPPAGRDLTETEILHIQNELEYQVRRIVDRLRHRKENSLLYNEPDLTSVFTAKTD